jgi:ferritin-like metal-binding protein YciE
VFEAMDKRARGQTCEAINSLIEEGDEVVDEFPVGVVRDAGILANAQAVEHYEMALYGTIVAWAKSCGEQEIAQLRHETLEEEKKADTMLNGLAKTTINQQSVQQAA